MNGWGSEAEVSRQRMIDDQHLLRNTSKIAALDKGYAIPVEALEI